MRASQSSGHCRFTLRPCSNSLSVFADVRRFVIVVAVFGLVVVRSMAAKRVASEPLGDAGRARRAASRSPSTSAGWASERSGWRSASALTALVGGCRRRSAWPVFDCVVDPCWGVGNLSIDGRGGCNVHLAFLMWCLETFEVRDWGVAISRGRAGSGCGYLVGGSDPQVCQRPSGDSTNYRSSSRCACSSRAMGLASLRPHTPKVLSHAHVQTAIGSPASAAPGPTKRGFL